MPSITKIMSLVPFALLASLLAAPTCLSAQASPGSPLELQYARSLWGVSDGLPEDTVQAITESGDGLLWIGTTGGLVRFDGAHLQVWGASGLAGARAEPVLPVNSIFCLTRARDGSLWAGTEGGGLLHLHDNALTVYGAKDGLTDSFVRSVHEDERRRIWVGTDSGLFLLEHDRLQRVNEQNGLAPLAIHSIAEDRDHRIWVGGSSLLAINASGRQQVFPLPGDYSKNRVKTILQTADGVIWVGTVGGLQYMGPDVDHGQFRTLAGIHATVRSLLQTSDGALWIGTIGGGLWTFRDGRLLRISSPGLLPSDTVLSIFEDGQKQVWVGTQAGLVRLDQTSVRVVALPEGSDPDYETIAGDSAGDIWVAAQRLYRIHDGKAEVITYPELNGAVVRNIYRARDGSLWIGTDGSGAYRINAGNVTHYSAPGELTNNFVRGFLETRNGDMWIATDEGVTRIGNSGGHTDQKLTEADGLAYFSTRSLLEDSSGGIWIGTDRGLSHWRNGAFVQDDRTRTLAQEKVWSLLEDRQGTLWFGTRDHGLFRYREGALTHFTAAQGLPSNSVYQILQDRRGTFWLTGPNVIASLSESVMDGEYPAEDHPMSATVYSMPYGADNAQMYGGRQPSGFLAPDDSVWFPSNRGAVHVAAVEQAQSPAPRAAIDDVAEDGRSVPIDGDLRVAAHIARLSFGFGAVFLRSQEGVRFRYKLQNFDPAWNNAAAGRSATYTNLRAGRYVFRVQAFDVANPTQVTEADIVIVKAPVFYETWWFYLLCGLGVASLIWLVYKMRVRQMKTRFDAVLEERSRLAREMHDTVIQGCTGISALLEAIASTGNGADAQRELLDYARMQARTTIDEARQAVWNMRHDREPGVDVVEAMRGIASQTMREMGNTVRFDHNVDVLEMGASAGHEVLMIVREAIYNSVQHSGVHQVDLQVRVAGEDLGISVTDSGVGFSADDPAFVREGHYGVVGMKERMQRLGGTLEVISSAGAGTSVRLQLSRAATRQLQGQGQ